jgi:DNA-binding response OmpR family regulator
MPFTESGLFTKTGKPARILIIESSPSVTELMISLLNDPDLMVGIKLDILQATTLADALQIVQDHRCDGVICDLELPDSHGIETFKKLNSATDDIPIVVITAEDSPQLGIDLTQSGAEDYIVKGSMDGQTLIMRLRLAFERWKQRQLRKASMVKSVVTVVQPAETELIHRIESVSKIPDGELERELNRN